MVDNVRVYEVISDIYDDLHPRRDGDWAFYRSFVASSSTRVLDVACGTGALTFQLAEICGPIVGLDAAPAMLGVAAARVPKARFIRGDMRDFQLDENFDLITCGLNTLQHLETRAEVITALRAMSRRLAPGGQLVFDIFNPSPAFRKDRSDVRLFSLGNGACAGAELREDTRYCVHDNLLHVTWRIVRPDSGLEVRRADYTMRQISHDEMNDMIDAAGLTRQAVYGDFDKSAFVTDSPKQVFVVGNSP